MVNALEHWHRVQELCETLEAVPATRHAEVLDTIEPNPGLRAETLALLRAFTVESRMQRSLPRGAAASSTAAAPDFISYYRIVGWLGSGGSADVFHAIRNVHGAEQAVALKRFVFRLSGRDELARFIREQRILAAAIPASVAQFFDAGITDDGRPFVVTELVEGEPITDYCDRHQLSLDARLRLMRRVCRAVQIAHQHLTAHLDLKPSNVRVTPEGQIKLLDFGTARLLESTRGIPGSPSLTLLYASPEQLRGAPPSAACDIYSLGLILYEVASGGWPFDGADTMMSVAGRAIGQSDPLPIDRPPSIEVAAARRSSVGSLTRRLGGDLDAVCRKALAHEPSLRYATVAELEDDLRRLQAVQPISAYASSVTYRLRKFFLRNYWALAAISLVAAGVALAIQSSAR